PTTRTPTDKSSPIPTAGATEAAALSPTVAPPALTDGFLLPGAPASTPTGTETKESHTPIARSSESGQTETSAAAPNLAPTARRAAAKKLRQTPNTMETPATGNQPLRLAVDAQRNRMRVVSEEAKQPDSSALPLGRPLSLAPDAHGGAAAPP